ncbi:Rho-type GTPase activating protein Rga1 [Exophiala xenobiotica]|uniref:Rho-type GTPase activating protein Rga1 n=1 Tax=Lithohypha guttulata TaxID=1690604 RepID=A0ABR0K8X7_9EURO|nr:Rho-type GTPase activating protein Rga1 [Lithohypha guttulata]KAK5319333.1 Rho-type GTPase activating protein Rga1 [Exophiala xenobiotica]
MMSNPYANGNAMETQADNAANRQSSESASRVGRKRSQEKDGKGRSRSRTNSNKGHRTCKKCGEALTGQFVRALGGTFHLDCFKCRDCGQIVASKFFPVDEDDSSGQFPLCETDYFRRLDLLCFECGGALRGSYITALERKYHIEHFTCSVCPTIFGAQDSYYEHDGKVYCHYHYSTQFAQRCNGCQTAILKQFVEIFRNGQNQHWHPECYMIHKFWNVRLAPSGPTLPRPDIGFNVTNEQRELVKEDEEKMEEKVYRIWSILSTFEESSASCISDMLLHVSNGVYIDGIIVARKFIWHVDILFGAIDSLAALVVEHGLKELAYGREAKLLCKKVVAFFTLLSRTQETGVRKLGVTQELLSLVTGLAHYLKLLIRIGLQGALKLERERGTTEGLNAFLDELADLETIKENEMKSLDLNESTAGLANQDSDCCAYCNDPIDDECVMIYGRRWHVKPPHLHCSTCKRDLTHDLASAVYSEREDKVYCINHSSRAQETVSGFSHVTKLQQYVFLLKVALARLLEVLKSGGTLPHTSEDPNLTPYDNVEGHRLSPKSERERRMGSRSRSYAGASRDAQPEESSLQQTVGEMKRLRSTRNERTLSTTFRKARESRILDGPQGVQPGSPNSQDIEGRFRNKFSIVDERSGEPRNKNSLVFGSNQDGLTLDDIPRIVAAEQAKEQRPNASRFAGENLLGHNEQPKLINTSQRRSTGHDLLANEPATLRTKRYFSELSALEYLIVRTVSVITMQPLLESHGFTMEELLGLIESRKTTFWGKVSKALRNEPKNKKKGVFGIAIESLVEREGAESTNGVGPGALKVPAIVDDAIAAMRQMDMSVEGVFRKNGNIKRLKDTAESIDNNQNPDLEKENAVQVAALLKKFLRDMPDPLMTFKLHKLWITSQRLDNHNDKIRLLHLICCLLPKCNRDTMEVLFSFLKWAASFSQVDEESGSKMDIHNLATVMAPNILYAPPPKQGSKGPQIPQVDESFLAIEAVNLLIKYNETMCEVPEDLQSILTDSALHTASADMSTKEILARYGHIVQGHVQPQKVGAPDGPGHSPSNSQKANGMATRIDIDANQANALRKQSSARPLQNQTQQNNSAHDLGAPNAPFAADRAGSQSSQEGYSPNNIRSSYQAKAGVPGMAS